MAKAFAKGFYNSKTWQACRDNYIAHRRMIDGGMCEACHINLGEELHHKKFLNPGNIHDSDYTVKSENLIWLCKDCHFKEHRDAIVKGFERKRNAKILNNGVYIDDNGQVQPMRVYIVYGAPCSGKTEYVKKYMNKTDLVVDLDAIRTAITYSDRNTESNNLLALALTIRDAIYRLISERDEKIDCKNVWIVSTLPRREEREELANKLRAELVYIPATYEECIERAKADDNRSQKDLQISIINGWFEHYEA